MNKSGLHWRDWWLFGTLYQMCRLFGVLPVQRTSRHNHFKQPKGTVQNCFSPSTNFRTVTVVQIVVYLFIGYQLAPKEVDLTLETVLWSINLVSPLAALVVPLFTWQDLASCMSSACRIHFQTPVKNRRLPIHMFLFMTIAPFFAIVYQWIFYFDAFPYRTLFRLTTYNYTYVVVTTVEVHFSSLCFVGERNLSHIRSQLLHIRHQQLTIQTFNSLKFLLEQYLEVSQFITRVDNNFSIHFLNIFCSFALRLIVYAAYFIENNKKARIISLVLLAIHGMYQIIRLLFLCYRCEKVKEEAVESTLAITRIRVFWEEDLTATQSALLDTYEGLIEATPIGFSACGFFPVNMLQALNVLGLVVTYSLVALESK